MRSRDRKQKPCWRRRGWWRFVARRAAWWCGLLPDVALLSLGGQYRLAIAGRVPDYGTRSLWTDICRRDPCAYCGAAATTTDHVVPRCVLGTRRKGGWENKAAACAACNQAKANMPVLLFLVVRSRQREWQRQRQRYRHAYQQIAEARRRSLTATVGEHAKAKG